MGQLSKWVAIIFVGIVIISFFVSKNSVETTNIDTAINEEIPEQPIADKTFEQAQVVPVALAEVVPEKARPDLLNGPSSNAVRSAEQYLSMTGFSRDGLIEQLSSEYGSGYDVADATTAVDSLNIDWNKQAVRSAEQYLNITGFSCDGLIEQLSSSAGSKYTVSEATYGAQHVGAC